MTATIPTTAAELEEMLADDTKMKALFNQDGAFGEFVKNYVEATTARDASIEQQVRDEVQRVTAQFLKDNADTKPGRVPMAPGAGHHDRGATYNATAAGAQLDAMFDSADHYLRTIWHKNEAPEAIALKTKLRNDFSTVTPADGGFLVPETLRAQLLQTSLESSIVRPRATVVPMETQRIPFPTVEGGDHTGGVFGGMVAYWTEEAGELVRSSAKFGRVVLDAKKLTGYSIVPNEVFSDSITSFSAFLSQTWPQAIAWTEDSAFFSGTGAGEPLGFLKAPAAVTIAKETGQAADTVTWENIVKMYARMLPTSLGSAVWIANIDVFPALATMALNVGTGGSAIWLNNGVTGPPMTILGRPVIFTEKAETLGDAGDINFVDLSYYLIGDRQQMQMATSEHIMFDTDQTAVRIIQRGDGRPWLQKAITPKKGAGTLSPFVKIAARA